MVHETCTVHGLEITAKSAKKPRVGRFIFMARNSYVLGATNYDFSILYRPMGPFHCCRDLYSRYSFAIRGIHYFAAANEYLE